MNSRGVETAQYINQNPFGRFTLLGSCEQNIKWFKVVGDAP